MSMPMCLFISHVVFIVADQCCLYAHDIDRTAVPYIAFDNSWCSYLYLLLLKTVDVSAMEFRWLWS